MKDKIVLLIVLIGFYSRGITGGNGGFAGSFLRIGLGARALAMGNAQVASPGNGFGNYYNPAGMPFLEQPRLSLSYSVMSLDRRFNFIGFSMPLPPFAGVSVGWIYSGVGNLRAYDSRGEDVGKIDHGLHALYFSFGLKIIQMFQQSDRFKGLPTDLLSIGISMKYLREGLNDQVDFNYVGKGFGFDFGILFKPHSRLSIGYQVKDVNAKLKSNTNDIFERGSTLENKFPLTQKAGFYFSPPLKWLQITYDFEWSNAGQEKHHFGVEMTSHGVMGRLGIDQDHFTFGGGLDFRAFKKVFVILDYAFIDSVIDEGVSHVFSWQFLF